MMRNLFTYFLHIDRVFSQYEGLTIFISKIKKIYDLILFYIIFIIFIERHSRENHSFKWNLRIAKVMLQNSKF